MPNIAVIVIVCAALWLGVPADQVSPTDQYTPLDLKVVGAMPSCNDGGRLAIPDFDLECLANRSGESEVRVQEVITHFKKIFSDGGPNQVRSVLNTLGLDSSDRRRGLFPCVERALYLALTQFVASGGPLNQTAIASCYSFVYPGPPMTKTISDGLINYANTFKTEVTKAYNLYE